MANLYSVLQVRPQCSMEELKSAYRRCARETHPDRHGDAEQFRRIQAAYAILGDADQRALYDTARRAWMQRIGAIECAGCGHANLLPRRPLEDERVVCSSCKTPLQLTRAEADFAQRQALVHEAARLIDEVGVSLAALTSEAVRAGLERLGRRLGLGRKP